MNPTSRRNAVIAGSVILFHAAALWALQTGLIRRAIEVVVPVEILSEIITPEPPKVEPAPQPKPPEPVKREPVPVKKVLPPAPQPVATPTPAPSPNAPVGIAEPQPPAPAVTAPVAPAPPAPPVPPRIELPSSDADYLQNPPPPYPPMSKRLGESGTVSVQVMISAEGTVQGEPRIAQSSGFDRLDQAALAAVRKWRFVPGKRNGVAVAMSYVVPVKFEITNR